MLVAAMRKQRQRMRLKQRKDQRQEIQSSCWPDDAEVKDTQERMTRLEINEERNACGY